MATMKNLLDVLEQQSGTSEELYEKVQLLFRLCTERMDGFETKLKDFLKDSKSLTGFSFPVAGSADSQKQCRFVLPETDTYLMPHIQYCINDVFKGEISEAVRYDMALTVDHVLEQLMSIGKGNEQSAQGFSVAVEGAMNLVRVDYIIWCRRSAVGTMEKTVEYAVAYVAIKSNIDVSRINFNDFCCVYQKVLLNGLPEDLSVSEKSKLILEAVESAKAIFTAMGGKFSDAILLRGAVKAPEMVRFSDVTAVDDGL